MATLEEENKVAEERVAGCGLSRREFLKNAGFVIGGASLGSLALANACSSSGATATQTVTKTAGAGTTVTVTQVGTATVSGAAQTAALANGAQLVHYIINGVDYYGAVQPYWTLLYVLREKLGFIAAKKGCDMGDCGVCAIIVNDRIINSCIMLAVEADGAKIQTLEGLAPAASTAAGATGTTLDKYQQAWVDNDAMQCGFCTSGMIMTARALLAFKAKPTDAEIKEFMAGTICRCGAYVFILKAIKQVAGT